MTPSAPTPPSPQEIHQKLSTHPNTKGSGITAMRPFKASKPSVSGTGTGTESDSASDSILSPDLFAISPQGHGPPNTGGIFSDSPSLQPLSSIAEHRSGSGEDSEDDADDEGARNVDIQKTVRNSAIEGVLKSGYLWKKGERRKTWKKRWFVLRPAHLAYYKSSAEYKLLRLLDLSEIHSCTQINLKKHENAFGLVSAARTFYLQAETQSEVQEWIKALEDARHALMATSTQNSIHGSIPIPDLRPRSGSLPQAGPSLSPSLSRHRPTHTQNITSSDSDDPSPQAQYDLGGSAQIHPVSASPTKSHIVPAPDLGKTVLSGYLMKCGSKRKIWRKRWFVLTGEHLMYSASHMDKKPHGKFPFSEIIDALEYKLPSRHTATAPASAPTSTGAANTEEGDDSQSKHTFKIITTKRTLLLCSPTEEEEINWLGAVRALIARRTGAGIVPGDTVGVNSKTMA